MEHRRRARRMRVRGPVLCLLAGPAWILAGCDLSFSHDDGDTHVEGRVRAEQSGLRLADDALRGSRSLRSDETLSLAFTGELDGASVRDAVRVTDLSRRGAEVDVEAWVEGEVLRLRPAGGEPFREGANLRVDLAGMPSLRSLRARSGEALRETTRIEFVVLSPRRADRRPPTLISSDPAADAQGVDPDAPLVLMFSEPMDPASFVQDGRAGLRLLAEDEPVPFGVHLDRHRTTATVVPEGLPGGARVVLDLGSRLRDASGNRLSLRTSRRIRFTTATRGAGVGGIHRLVESFDDSSGMDPAGTTVAWGTGAAPGVLSGAVTTIPLHLRGEGARRALLLDPAGGSLLMVLPQEFLGDEGRLLKGLALETAPGVPPGGIVDLRIRLASVAAGGFPFLESPGPWTTVTEVDGVTDARGTENTFDLPFQHPFLWAGEGLYPGDGGLLLEVEWSGVTGPVVLTGAETAGARPVLTARGRESVMLRFLPGLRIDTVGERAVARSLWRDSGTDAPRWLEPAVNPQAGDRMRIEFQVASSSPDGRGPDLSRVSPWTVQPGARGEGRFIRFRVVFTETEGASPAVLDDVVLPYR